jgi:hypothetical protein
MTDSYDDTNEQDEVVTHVFLQWREVVLIGKDEDVEIVLHVAEQRIVFVVYPFTIKFLEVP